jgi:hypothetical protein
MGYLRPDIVSRPSLLTAVMYEASPLTVHRAQAIRAGRLRPSPALQRLRTPSQGIYQSRQRPRQLSLVQNET